MQVVDSKLASVTFLIICKVEVFTHSSAMLLSSIKAYRMEMLSTHQWALWSGTFPGLSFAACMILRQTSLFGFSCSACSAILLSCIKALSYRLVWSNLGAAKYWFYESVALFNWISSSLLPAVRKRGLYLLIGTGLLNPLCPRWNMSRWGTGNQCWAVIWFSNITSGSGFWKSNHLWFQLLERFRNPITWSCEFLKIFRIKKPLVLEQS